MLKIRVMPTLLWKENNLVKGEKFDSWRQVGGAMQAIKVYNLREVDELVFLDVAATLSGSPPDFELIDELADECFVPLTVGGGVRDLEDVRHLLQVGADKVAIGSAAIENPALIERASRRFGAQCVVVSIDFSEQGGHCEVFSHCGTRSSGKEVVEWAMEVEKLGAGEILLTSIPRDGTFTGYDLEMIERVSQAVHIPIIASGGAGNYEDMDAALKKGASAVAAASLFHFTQATPREAKQYLASQGHAMRL